MDIKAIIIFWFMAYGLSTVIAEVETVNNAFQPPSCPLCARVRPSLTGGRGEFRPGFNQHWNMAAAEPNFGIIRKREETATEEYPHKKHHSYSSFLISGRGRFRPGFKSDYWESLLAEPNFTK